ncbi:DUF6713 family protein [Phaeodactylibacter sp.]|jgi:hypothetical protein|uniref:DUF6713 family protein n=1 Tax=Phaeodactylibacter sp. TaxID=1940289 RepID=UPI0025FB0EFF|nr:DUF6713 family protein [Phaeodactylibacter sp.]MCI4649110.1 hypothetical protein [Phaeodactylibacter sp.]MCI5091511.1 hypothetical protein [Phaeodactylibacter sp.]
MADHTYFYIGLALMAMHEMDAIRCREWRIFPGLSKLSDRMGFLVFLYAHIPLFYFVFYRLSSCEDHEKFIDRFDIFMIVHLGLHVLFLKHENNEFKDWVSWTIIIGAGICGLIDFFA